MAGFFKNNQTNQPISERHALMNKYNVARSNLLLVAIFTAVNLILLISKSFVYFLFSASIPYVITDVAMFFCGMYPDEYYTGELAGMEFFDSSLFVAALIISIIIVALYVLAYFLSKNGKVVWLITALAFFVVDTLVMFWFYGFSVDMIFDIIFHIWVIGSFSMGIYSYLKLKKLPSEESFIISDVEGGDFEARPDRVDSKKLRVADTDVKSKTLLELEAFGHKIVYRRVKRVNELVIDNNVYAEYEALLERPHTLTANLDGHAIAVGFDGTNSYATIDSKTVVQKIRLI